MMGCVQSFLFAFDVELYLGLSLYCGDSTESHVGVKLVSGAYLVWKNVIVYFRVLLTSVLNRLSSVSSSS